MTVTEVLGSLGSWSLKLTEGTPDEILTKLNIFGHIAIVRGRVDVALTGDVILSGARYVGVLRESDKATGRTLSGSGMIYWLGDEDHKGKVIENKITFTANSLTFCLNAVLPPSVHLGVIHDPGGTYTGSHQYQTPRDALDIICAAFGVEYRVNGNGTIDVGTQAQLYATVPKTTIVSRGAGSDLDLTALGGAFDVDTRGYDYSTRILLLGQTTDGGSITTGSVSAGSVPYRDLFGNLVSITRMISESGQTTGSVAARAQLQLNRFNRFDTALKVTAENYEIEGTFAVGDNAFVFDPATGLVDAAQERYFRGERINPAVIRISALTWPVTDGHTVAFRAQDGTWYDLTRYVVWENGSAQITVGDMPKTLTSSPNPVQDRADAAPDLVPPNAPTALTLTTFAVVDSRGGNSAVIRASWTAPTQSTDGSTLADFAYYIVSHRVTGRPQWETTYSDSPTIDLPAVIDITYDVRVAAVDKSNNQSAYTATSTIHTAIDTTAPNPPSDPSVGNYIGQLRIVWDGKDNTGAAMENGAIVNVHVSATSGFTPDNSPGSLTLVSQLSAPGAAFATAPYGSTRYVKLVAVDTSKNFSAPSGQVSGSTSQATNGDIASLDVGKLTAGTILVDVLMGGRIAVGGLTGARLELNTIGLQGFLADGVTKWLNFDGVANLLTGTFQTDLTGRRAFISAAGTTAEVDFFAPDGTKTYVRAFTESVGVESIQLGMPAVGTTNTRWNKVHVNSDEWMQFSSNKIDFTFGKATGFFVIRQTTDKGAVGTNTQVRLQIDAAGAFQYIDQNSHLRFRINDTTINFYDAAGQPRFGYDSGNTQLFSPNNAIVAIAGGSTTQTAWIRQFTTGGFGTAFIAATDDGAGTNVRNELKWWDGSFWVPIWASAFVVPSDEALKTSIADFSDDTAIGHIRSMRPRTYRLKKGPGKKPATQLGIIAQEAPDVVRTEADGTSAVDLYPLTVVGLAAIKNLDRRLSALEGKAS